MEDEEASAMWNDTLKRDSPDNPAQKTEPSPVAGARSKSPAWGADAGQPDTGVANTTDPQHPKREPDQRANIRWAETSSQVQNVRPPFDFVGMRRRETSSVFEMLGLMIVLTSNENNNIDFTFVTSWRKNRKDKRHTNAQSC